MRAKHEKSRKTTATNITGERRKTTATNITGETTNEVDGLFAIARGLDHVAFEIRALGERALLDAVREIKATVSEKASEVIQEAAQTIVEDRPAAKKRRKRR